MGDTSFVDSLLLVLEHGPVRARLACLAPIDAAGAHRRELAQAARAAVADALHAPAHQPPAVASAGR